MITRADVWHGLVITWLLLLVAIVVAAYRNAFEADRRESELDAAAAALTLADFAPRVTQKHVQTHHNEKTADAFAGIVDRSHNLRGGE